MFTPSKEERLFAERLKKSYKTLRVEGRGLVTVDVTEVQNSEEFKKNLERARALRAKQLVNR